MLRLPAGFGLCSRGPHEGLAIALEQSIGAQLGQRRIRPESSTPDAAADAGTGEASAGSFRPSRLLVEPRLSPLFLTR